MGFNLPEPCQWAPALFISTLITKSSTFSGGISLLFLLITGVFAWHPKGKKNNGPSAASETHLITSTSFQRAPVVALQVYSNPSKCQTKAPLSSCLSDSRIISVSCICWVAAAITITQGQDLAWLLHPQFCNRRECLAG